MSFFDNLLILKTFLVMWHIIDNTIESLSLILYDSDTFMILIIKLLSIIGLK